MTHPTVAAAEPANSTLPDRGYLPKLDGLRAISILLVMIEHFLWSGHGIFKGTIPVGGLGVTIFFVISGYLITSILVSYADSMPVKAAAAKFYWRRTLRLFPVYYLCIAVAAALNIGGMRANWWVNALYLMNFKVVIDQAWNGSSHFWSLAVEEQFYLLWFLVVVMVPRRYLLRIIAVLVVAAPLWRGLVGLAGGSAFWGVLLPGVIDSLATGALLSYAVNSKTPSSLWKGFQRRPVSWLLVSVIGLAALEFWGDANYISSMFIRTDLNLLSASLVLIAIDKRSDKRFDWLGGKAIRHIGKISYGLYVYHNFLPALIPASWFSAIHNAAAQRLSRFLVLAVLSVCIAEISWRVLEEPILKFKNRIPRKAPRPPAITAIPA